MNYYDNAFGFDNADATFYDSLARNLTGYYKDGYFNIPYILKNIAPDADFSDLGYPTYLSFIYFLTNDSIIIARIIKCILSSYTVVLMYRLSSRNFGEQVGRLTAVFCMMAPNLIYYCGVHIKEVEMVLLSVLFVEKTDFIFRSNSIPVIKLIYALIIASVLFSFRTPLAVVCILSLLFSLVVASSKAISWNKRVIVILLAVSIIGITLGYRVYEETNDLIERVSNEEQKSNMEWRMRRRGGVGNQFAKYAGTVVFAPMIFTIPFPTMVETPSQEIQRIHQVGNYVKNILSFFVIFAVAVLIMRKRWRNHVVPLSFLIGYLLVLALSTFAQSERFHQPVQPIEMMFAAYGISLCGKREQRWFNYWMMFLFVVILFWQWFKLKGKGLI